MGIVFGAWSPAVLAVGYYGGSHEMMKAAEQAQRAHDEHAAVMQNDAAKTPCPHELIRQVSERDDGWSWLNMGAKQQCGFLESAAKADELERQLKSAGLPGQPDVSISGCLDKQGAQNSGNGRYVVANYYYIMNRLSGAAATNVAAIADIDRLRGAPILPDEASLSPGEKVLPGVAGIIKKQKAEGDQCGAGGTSGMRQTVENTRKALSVYADLKRTATVVTRDRTLEGQKSSKEKREKAAASLRLMESVMPWLRNPEFQQMADSFQNQLRGLSRGRYAGAIKTKTAEEFFSESDLQTKINAHFDKLRAGLVKQNQDLAKASVCLHGGATGCFSNFRETINKAPEPSHVNWLNAKSDEMGALHAAARTAEAAGPMMAGPAAVLRQAHQNSSQQAAAVSSVGAIGACFQSSRNDQAQLSETALQMGLVLATAPAGLVGAFAKGAGALVSGIRAVAFLGEGITGGYGVAEALESCMTSSATQASAGGSDGGSCSKTPLGARAQLSVSGGSCGLNVALGLAGFAGSAINGLKAVGGLSKALGAADEAADAAAAAAKLEKAAEGGADVLAASQLTPDQIAAQKRLVDAQKADLAKGGAGESLVQRNAELNNIASGADPEAAAEAAAQIRANIKQELGDLRKKAGVTGEVSDAEVDAVLKAHKDIAVEVYGGAQVAGGASVEHAKKLVEKKKIMMERGLSEPEADLMVRMGYAGDAASAANAAPTDVQTFAKSIREKRIEQFTDDEIKKVREFRERERALHEKRMNGGGLSEAEMAEHKQLRTHGYNFPRDYEFDEMLRARSAAARPAPVPEVKPTPMAVKPASAAVPSAARPIAAPPVAPSSASRLIPGAQPAPMAAAVVAPKPALNLKAKGPGYSLEKNGTLLKVQTVESRAGDLVVVEQNGKQWAASLVERSVNSQGGRVVEVVMDRGLLGKYSFGRFELAKDGTLLNVHGVENILDPSILKKGL